MQRDDPIALPKLNYLWIGPPAPISSSSSSSSSSSLSNFGNDIKDVLDMTANCQNPIYYYCLKEYKNHYQKLFENQKTTVHVVSVEEYLSAAKMNGTKASEYVDRIRHIQNEILKGSSRNRIADRTSFKVLFSFFILATDGGYAITGGYTLDTNVKLINQKEKFIFQDYNDFHVPFIRAKDGNWIAECWMMYVPHEKSDIAFNILQYYLSHWDRAQKIIEGNERNVRSIHRYAKFIGGVTISSITETLRKTSNMAEPPWEFKLYDPNEENVASIAIMDSPPVQKTYNNSHKPEYEAKKVLLEDIQAYNKKNAKKKELHFMARNDFHNRLITILEEYHHEKNRDKLYTLNLGLFDLFNALQILDKILIEHYDISFNYKSHDEKKQDFANKISEMIEREYSTLHDCIDKLKTLAETTGWENLLKLDEETSHVDRFIEKLPSRLEALQNSINNIIQEAAEYHYTTHAHDIMMPNSRFKK